jgi:hypothetical protein
MEIDQNFTSTPGFLPFKKAFVPTKVPVCFWTYYLPGTYLLYFSSTNSTFCDFKV